MVAKNTHLYRSNCPVAYALDVIGDHWTLLLVRDLLLLERHEFKDMLEGKEGISSNILVDRLKKLELNGLLASIPHPQSKKRKLYYLTLRGKGLIDVIISIARWSVSHGGDILQIPPGQRWMLMHEPETLIKQSLEHLQAWERSYGITV